MFEWLFGSGDHSRVDKVSKHDINVALDLIAQYLGKRSNVRSYTTGSCDEYREAWTNVYSDAKITIESEHKDDTEYELVGKSWNDDVYSRGIPYRVRAWLAKDHMLVFDSRPNREWDSSVGRWIEDTSFREGAWISYVMEELLPKATKRQNEVMTSLKKKQEAAERAYADKVKHRNRPVDDSDVFH